MTPTQSDPARVPRPDRELVAALRAELAAIDPGRACDRAAERRGLGPDPRPGDQPVARLVHRLAAELPAEPATTDTALDWAAAADHCRIAWLRGRFLAHGSLSLASGRTHLEFVVPVDEAAELARRLATIGLPAPHRTRRGRGVVTWKSADAVGTFLRLIGAGAALLELEARQVSRALRGDLNRVINAESANLQRAVTAAGRQLVAIDRLDAEGVLGQQPYVVRLVAEGRRETPEATLAELAERLQLHRSAVQRALERVEWLALHDAPAEGPIGRGRTDRRRRAGRVGPSSRSATGDAGSPLA
ncbi:MAG TPA: DNA-binding protein WhiA [Candidatus Dormibacteraeota bacterium]|nr:DNA-binding protein WhiA [Candidatus Dormibacteraeota bacterium]